MNKVIYKKLTKADLVDRLYERINERKKSVRHCLDAFIREMETLLSQGYSVELRGLGTFELHRREGRRSLNNPKTNKKMTAEQHCIPFFRPGRRLKEAVRNYKENLSSPE